MHVGVGEPIEVAAQVYGCSARRVHGQEGEFPLDRFMTGRAANSHHTGAPFTQKYTVKRMYHPAISYLL